ncbi:MAG: RdgB/HAM1 family non-canonical purine NTP pyrophosphatase [Candidatus Riflebacteria bacterium]|nr:RdgB/HAM1 family non-canonical purine NTP pyrophosphatase [Candidatus Riflebacteria bacterium]
MNIWVATKNAHKVEEISKILAPIKIKSFLDLNNVSDVEEDGVSYEENALIKAKALFEIVKEPVMADDSGLEVDALNGAPGIYSSRFGGIPVDHDKNINKLLAELKELPLEKRTARFRCVIVYLDSAGKPHEFSGTLEGIIANKRTGNAGFGYDPIFWLPERKCSVAELTDTEKNTISHRSRALQKFIKFIKG